MNFITAVFTACHIISFLLSVLTCLIMGTENPNARRQNQRKAIMSHRIVRTACINIALISFTVLLPGLIFNFELDRASVATCWIQGLILHYCFLCMHTLTVVLSLHNWFLIVRWDFDAELRYEKYYWAAILFIPLAFVLCGVLISGASTSWWTEASQGIAPRTVNCFWNEPHWWRLVGYVIPYFIATLIGGIFSVWVAVCLFKTRAAQKEAVRQLIKAATENGSPILSGSPHAQGLSGSPNTQGYTRLYKTISRSSLYRTTLFATVYALVGTLSFVPSAIKYIDLYENGGDWESDGQVMMSPGEFASCLVGIGIFLVFGTGEQGHWFIRSMMIKKGDGKKEVVDV